MTSAYLYDGFFPLRTDIVRYYAACSVLETAENLLVEDGDCRAMFVAAVEALKNLALTDGDAAEFLAIVPPELQRVSAEAQISLW